MIGDVGGIASLIVTTGEVLLMLIGASTVCVALLAELCDISPRVRRAVTALEEALGR